MTVVRKRRQRSIKITYEAKEKNGSRSSRKFTTSVEVCLNLGMTAAHFEA